MATNHHGKTWTEVHGVSAKTRRNQQRTHKLQQKQYEHFGKVNWDYFSHQQMYDMVQSAKPEHMYDKARQWENLSGQIQQTTGQVQSVMQNLMGSWRGSAAVTAGESNSKLTTWGGQAGNTANTIAAGLEKYADAVSHAQATMPTPVDYTAEHRLAEGYAVKINDPELNSYILKNLGDDHMATREEAKTAKARAIQVMQGYEDRSHDVHQNLPEFDQAPSMAPKPTGPVTGGPPVNGPVLSPPTDGGPVLVSQPVHKPDPTHKPDPNPGSGGDGTGTTTTSGFVPPTGGGPTGFQNPAFPNTGFPSPGAGNPGPQGAGALGGGFAAGLGSGPAGEGPEGMRSGALGGAAAAEDAAVGRGGMGMYPPMGGNGARGDGDGEHHNKYDDGLDLFDDVPPAYPSVFGE